MYFEKLSCTWQSWFLFEYIENIVSSQFDLPHGNELKEWVDQGFALFDKNKDGIMTKAEMVYIENSEDLNRKQLLHLYMYIANI